MSDLVDPAVVLGIIGALYVGLVLTVLAVNPSSFRFPAIGVLFSTTVTFGISVLYLAGCWVVSGYTVGAAVMGLRVTGRKTERLSAVLALLGAVRASQYPSD